MKQAERIVSLVPSATEIVCSIGLGARLVGRSHECDHPAWVQRLPAVTAQRIDTDQPSRAIDGDVKRMLSSALSLYDLDEDTLADLRPDLVVTQDQCDVCAVSFPEVERALGELTGGSPALLSLRPDKLADVFEDVRRTGEAAGVPNAAAELAATLAERVERLEERTRGLPRARVATLEWVDPLMAGGNWVPELVEAAGGRDIFGNSGGHAPWLEWERLVEADPDVIVTLPCGFDISRTRRELPALRERGEWPRLKAVREGRVYLTDGNQFFNRPGPRLVESAEILAEILHPDVFSFGHEGRDWARL